MKKQSNSKHWIKEFWCRKIREYHRGKFRNGVYARIIGTTSAVFMSAVLEYLVAEILELAGDAALYNKRRRIVPRHIMLAVRNDVELNMMLTNVVLPGGGVVSYICKELLPRKKALKDSAA